MEKIKKMAKQIHSELEDAEKYAECALKYKGTDDGLATLYFRLSGDEMGHMELLYSEVVEEIKEYKKDHGEAPAAMQAVWDYEHAKMMEEAAEVKALHALYKEM